MGPTLRFDEEALIAITGASFPVKLGGVEIPQYESVHVDSGQELEFGMVKAGARAYLAIAGGIQVKPVLGSRSENLFASRGPFGRALKQAGLPPSIEIVAEANQCSVEDVIERHSSTGLRSRSTERNPT